VVTQAEDDATGAAAGDLLERDDARGRNDPGLPRPAADDLPRVARLGDEVGANISRLTFPPGCL
jgi:hypothetical protein